VATIEFSGSSMLAVQVDSQHAHSALALQLLLLNPAKSAYHHASLPDHASSLVVPLTADSCDWSQAPPADAVIDLGIQYGVWRLDGTELDIQAGADTASSLQGSLSSRNSDGGADESVERLPNISTLAGSDVKHNTVKANLNLGGVLIARAQIKNASVKTVTPADALPYQFTDQQINRHLARTITCDFNGDVTITFKGKPKPPTLTLKAGGDRAFIGSHPLTYPMPVNPGDPLDHFYVYYDVVEPGSMPVPVSHKMSPLSDPIYCPPAAGELP
jgi:hypothetical protein